MIVQTKKNEMLTIDGNEEQLRAMAKRIGIKKEIRPGVFKLNAKKHRAKLLKVGVPLMRVPDVSRWLKKNQNKIKTKTAEV